MRTHIRYIGVRVGLVDSARELELELIQSHMAQKPVLRERKTKRVQWLRFEMGATPPAYTPLIPLRQKSKNHWCALAYCLMPRCLPVRSLVFASAVHHGFAPRARFQGNAAAPVSTAPQWAMRMEEVGTAAAEVQRWFVRVSSK